jgi:transcriptional regulator with XRE-family HTH domain
MPRISVKHDKDKHLVEIGKAVKTQRKSLKMSQEALADQSGIDRSHMGKIERGERNVTLLNLLRISDALGCPLSSLLINAGL